MSTLYKIGEDFDALASLVDDVADAETQAIIDQWLAELDGTLTDKAVRCIRGIKQWEADADAQKAEAARLLSLAKVNANRADRVAGGLYRALQAAGTRSLTTVAGNLTIQKNGGKAPLLIDDVDPAVVASTHGELTITKIELSKTAIREALEAGVDLDFARIGERGEGLRIK